MIFLTLFRYVLEFNKKYYACMVDLVRSLKILDKSLRFLGQLKLRTKDWSAIFFGLIPWQKDGKKIIKGESVILSDMMSCNFLWKNITSIWFVELIKSSSKDISFLAIEN